jgi:hypothetical protein
MISLLGQRSIDEYFPPITQPGTFIDSFAFLVHPFKMVDIFTPLIREPGGVVSTGRAFVPLFLIISQ